MVVLNTDTYQHSAMQSPTRPVRTQRDLSLFNKKTLSFLTRVLTAGVDCY